MFNHFIEKDGPYKLLEQFTKYGRTIIIWYNEADQLISGAIFSSNQINELSKRAKPTQWGYPTKFISNIKNTREAAEVAGLYIKDINNGNFWWENNLKA